MPERTKDTNRRPFALALHGGAGSVPEQTLELNRVSYLRALSEALEIGRDILDRGGEAADAVVESVKVLENYDCFNAGRGSVLDHNGEVSMDAAFVNGKDLSYGGVINVQNIKNPVALAKDLSSFGEHNIISGVEAAKYISERGLATEPMSYFVTDYRMSQYLIARERGEFCLDHYVAKNQEPKDDSKFGTVGAVALDSFGNLAAATSTGGITNKKYGRVGDSAILGAGTYANNETLAISATGRGELFTKHLVCADIHAQMKYLGLSLGEATKNVIFKVLPSDTGGVIAVDSLGNISMEFNTNLMFRACARQGSNPLIQWEKPL